MADDLSAALADVIRQRRVVAGLSIRQLGAAAGLARDSIGKVERQKGKRGGTVLTLAYIAEALGMRASELLAMAEARVESERVAA